MKTNTLLLVSILAAGVLSTPVLQARAPIPGYNVQDFSWDVETTPGGPTVVLNGTVEQVHKQLLKINPDYETHFNITNKRRHPEALAASHGSSSFTKRAPYTLCDNFRKANADYIWGGIMHLRTVPGQPKNGPGPSNCGRVSCDWGSEIWWCNDNTTPKELPGFNTIADAATVAEYDCKPKQQLGHSYIDDHYSAQRFHDDKWNVVIRGDKDVYCGFKDHM
ncbi:hypothetical protein B0H63DRAFT_447620 [Podospora didyma]|uniref:Ecp2 effector protein domain-containing protein n=1 Tax=Podospora didyma TaxID=330526 RepID=A0AAE0U0U6_9PEZI|nr:hypothetical protein B0H63DRAFT_447620 [Podospora didyma]